MCGISGFFGSDQVSLPVFYRAHSSLGHRGPDDEGFLVRERRNGALERLYGRKTIESRRDGAAIWERGTASFCFGHHRLSILDLSAAGHQPFWSSCGRYALVYNGEIYNYKELRAELERSGHVFRTTSDTEVLIQAYSQWREHCFKRFNGMWALAIYDTVSGSVVFSRDRFGVKPLYFATFGNSLFFASELKFFKHLGFSLSLDRQSAVDYLAYSLLDHSERTFYTEVRSVPPAHWLEFDIDGALIKKERYWDLPLLPQVLGEDEAIEKLHELLYSSIELRTRSDVGVGSLLSGGLDSTAIACLLAKNFELAGGKLQTFSAVFKEKQFSETEYINDTLRFEPRLQANFVIPKAADVKADFLQLLDTIETPFRSFSAYSQFRLYKYIRENSDIKVLLNGQGSDEIFGGYRGHYANILAEYFKRGKLLSAAAETYFAFHNRNGEAFQYLKDAAKSFIPQLPVKHRSYLSDDSQAGTFPLPRAKSLSTQLRTELQISALPEYLHYEDRNSMRFGLEARLPFLDYRVVELAFGMPSEMKIRNGVNKYALRRAVWDEVTPSVLYRKDKMGFTSPHELWQSHELKAWFNETLFSPDPTGLTNQAWIRDHSQEMTTWEAWRVFCFKSWQQQGFRV